MFLTLAPSDSSGSDILQKRTLLSTARASMTRAGPIGLPCRLRHETKPTRSVGEAVFAIVLGTLASRRGRPTDEQVEFAERGAPALAGDIRFRRGTRGAGRQPPSRRPPSHVEKSRRAVDAVPPQHGAAWNWVRVLIKRLTRYCGSARLPGSRIDPDAARTGPERTGRRASDRRGREGRCSL